MKEPKTRKELAEYIAWRFKEEYQQQGTGTNNWTSESARLAVFLEKLFGDDLIMASIIGMNR